MEGVAVSEEFIMTTRILGDSPDAPPAIVTALLRLDHGPYATHYLRIARASGPKGSIRPGEVAIFGRPSKKGYGGIAIDATLREVLTDEEWLALDAAVTVAKRRRSRAYIDAKRKGT